MEKINKEDLIRRSDAIDALKEHRALYCDNTPATFSKLSYPEKSRVDELDTAIATLINLPSAKPKHGKWHVKNDSFIVLDVCDQCMKSVRHVAPFYNFCPHCGADMR